LWESFELKKQKQNPVRTAPASHAVFFVLDKISSSWVRLKVVSSAKGTVHASPPQGKDWAAQAMHSNLS
jgi:hypothetical protein